MPVVIRKPNVGADKKKFVVN